MDKVVMERIDAIVNNLDPEIRELAKNIFRSFVLLRIYTALQLILIQS